MNYDNYFEYHKTFALFPVNTNDGWVWLRYYYLELTAKFNSRLEGYHMIYTGNSFKESK